MLAKAKLKAEQAKLKAEQAAEAARIKALELDQKHDLKQRAAQASARISASVEAAGDAAAAAVRDSPLLDRLVSDDGSERTGGATAPPAGAVPAPSPGTAPADSVERPCVASARCDRHCQTVAEHMAGGPTRSPAASSPAPVAAKAATTGGAALPPPLPRPESANSLALPSVPTALPPGDPPPEAKKPAGGSELLGAVRSKASVTAAVLGQRAAQLDEKYSLGEKAREAAEKTRAAAEDVRRSAAAAAEDAKAYYEREFEKPPGPESGAARCAPLALAPLPLIFSYKSEKSLCETGCCESTLCPGIMSGTC